MSEPVNRLFERIQSGLSLAGRSRPKVKEFLTELELDLNRSSGPRSELMNLEYHEYLMDNYSKALKLALAEAHETEEYEQAAEILASIGQVEKIIAGVEKKLQKVF